MSTREKQEQLIGRILSDSVFRRSLTTDPEGTLKSNGFDYDPGLVNAISQVSPETLEQMAQLFETGHKVTGSST